MKGLAAMLPGQSEPDPADELCAMCPSLTYQQVCDVMCEPLAPRLSDRF